MPKNKGETGKERVNNGASKKNLENEQWPLAKMFRYAKKRHPRKVTMENKEAIVRSIQKTLDAIGFPKTNGQYVVPRVIGEFIIDDLMAEYFHSAGRRDKRKEEKRKQLFEKYQRESAQEDQNLNEIQEFASYIYSFLRESEVIEENPKSVQKESSEEVQKESPQEVLEEIKKDPRVQKEYDEYWNHKSYFEYHIHTPTEEKFFWEDREKIVDRTMLRTLFFHFFDFQEIKFRKDLQDMSRHIDPVTNEFIEGYSMLADMLEYPMDKYITEKEKTQSTTLISKDEVKRANRNLREVGQQIKTVRDSIKLLSEQLRNLKDRIHYVRDKLEYSDEELTILNEDVKRTEKNIAELRADLNQLEQQMKNHIWVLI